ncbi:MAG: MBG domain-containing protein, partial [Verrucomicrobiota bacterium]
MAWDPSADPDVVGYTLYYGVASQTYTNESQVGNVTNATISGLVSGTTYFFAATATDSVGLESEFSNEVTYTVDDTVKPVLVVSADNVSRPYGATNVTLTGTLTGVQNGDNITATYTTSASANSPVGTYPVVPTLHDPDGKLSNYTVSLSNGTLTVTPALLTVTAANQARAYGAANPALTGTVSGVQNGDNLTASFSTAATAGSPVGTYSIVPAVHDPDGKLSNYSVSVNNGTLRVTPAVLTVTAAGQSRAYGAANPALTGTVSGVQNGDNLSASFSTAATAGSPVGAYSIVPTLNDPAGKLGNYTVSLQNGILTVNPATLTGRADNQSRLYGQANLPFTVTYSGFVNGDTTSVVIGTLVGSSPAQTNSPVGTYPIRVSGQGAANYTIQYEDGTLSVGPAPLVVQAADASRAYGQTNPVFTASLSGFVNGEGSNVLGG